MEFLNPYLCAVRLRELLYLKGIKKRCKFPAKVISIGNLSVGGTGKTPTTLELAKFLTSRGYRVSVVLRGYKREKKGTLLVSDGKEIFFSPSEVGDEAYLYARLLNIPVAVAERRCEGVSLVVERFRPDVVLLDDAFQHLAVERDLDIVLLTPKDLKDRVLPFGRLREPPAVLKRRGDFCLFTKTESYQPLEEFCKALGKPYGYLTLKGFKLFTPSLEEVPLSTLEGKEVGIVSALGDNETFQKQVFNLAKIYRFEVKKVLAFRDHYHYRGVKLDPNLLWLTTFKDLFKLEGVQRHSYGESVFYPFPPPRSASLSPLGRKRRRSGEVKGQLLAVERIFSLPEGLKEMVLEVLER